MIDDKYIEEMLKFNQGTSLITLWLWAKNYPSFNGDLTQAKEGFFYMAERLMRQGILRLASQGSFLNGSIDQQLKTFRDVWPEDYDENVEAKDIDNMWWYLFAPAGAVWIYPDGVEVWT